MSIDSAARWKSKWPILAELRPDHDVGRIAGKPRARDAILDDVERLDHDRRDARRSVIAADQLTAEDLLGVGVDLVGDRFDRPLGDLVGRVVLDDGAAAEDRPR